MKKHNSIVIPVKAGIQSLHALDTGSKPGMTNNMTPEELNQFRIARAKSAASEYPGQPEHLVAVTGTSGKSSVVDYFRQIAGYLGYKSACFGSLGVVCSDKAIEKEAAQFNTDLNTPDAITLHKLLSFLAAKNVTHVAFEASSHGIDQQRMCQVHVKAAGFTSFSQDHLDYHKNMEEYFNTKLRLFSENLVKGGTAVVLDELVSNRHFCFRGDDGNIEDDGHLLTVGCNGTIKILSYKPSLAGGEITFAYKNKEYNVTTHLVGSFQATNLLIACGLLEACGVKFDDMARVLHKVTAVAGRLQRITSSSDPWHVFVDYSHKPGALESSLNELKALCKNKLYVLFGCGGDRDKTKRKPMGEIAARIADYVIITDDNPRTENANDIRKTVMAGCPNAKEIENRREAIKYAVGQLQKGDILLVAGKGHETYQIIGTEKIHFDDTEEVRKLL